MGRIYGYVAATLPSMTRTALILFELGFAARVALSCWAIDPSSIYHSLLDCRLRKNCE